MQRIAIIGSGFCGTALAVHLLHNARRPLHLCLINRSGHLARGLAYGTRSASHILNVPAERMSLFPNDSRDFLNFARHHLPSAGPADFLPRRLYGDYLEQRLQQAIAAGAGSVNVTRLDRQVLDLQQDSHHCCLTLDDQTQLDSEQVVIATGNFSPTTPASLRPLADDPRYIRDPWREGALEGIPADARVLFVGTGLTMYDMALTLQDRQHTGPLYALSRRALLPQGHRDNSHHPVLPELPEALTRAARLNTLLAGLRRFIAASAQAGHDWRNVVAALRPVTPLLWQGLSEPDRQRFLRHLQPYWDVHRHRAAPTVARRIKELQSSGQLQIRAGRLLQASATVDSLSLAIQPRGKHQPQGLTVDVIINCTGPCTDIRSAGEILLDSLLERGTIQQDAQRLGLQTDPALRLLDHQGRAHTNLFLLSPMLRANHWESTAVPELREHAERLARSLLQLH